MMTTLALSSSLNRPNTLICSSSFPSADTSVAVNSTLKSSCVLAPPAVGVACGTAIRNIAIISSRRTNAKAKENRRRPISCEVALRSDSETSVSAQEEDEELNRATSKIGARVRVKGPLKVFHVPRVPEVDLTGMEGVLKQYVGLWKGKRISANFPFKVEFRTEIEGRGSVKFFAHLKEEEFEYLD
ncbi:hypothetical protein L1049_022691 [Liquidambar formosana]|uniref:Ferredoxin thioredoxin reductase alpha chain domain-containing protein n=1 Tax=Liquidambar formosana TaxID=63359 RepID=A0AAP0WQL7_LIQFO